MFKSLLLSLFAAMAVTAMAANYPASYYTLAPETTTQIGDVNCDGAVSSVDVTAIYNYLLNGDMTFYSTCDVNGDGSITSVDITVIYNILLQGSGGGTIPATSIKMQEYQNVTSTTFDYHTWLNVDNVYYGDVIFITLDGVEENMYVLVRTGGKWVLKDVGGSSKAGFKSNGTIKAIWVRGGDWNSAQVGNISVPYDYALGSGSYTLTGKTVSISLTLNLNESKVVLTGEVPSQIQNMSYCTRVNNVYDINMMCNGQSGEFVYSSLGYSTVVHIGSEYCVFGNHTDINSSNKTVFHATAPYGRSWRKTATTRLTQGRLMALVNPYPYDGSNGWVRDFTMRYYDADDTETSQVVYPGTTKTIHMAVGTELTFYPQEGSISNDGYTKSRASSNSSIVSAYASSIYSSTTIKAMSVGEANVTFTYKSSSTDEFNFTVHVVVEPAVWLAGSYNGKPALYRNGALKYNSLSVSATSLDQVFVRKGKAYIRTYDSNNPNAAPYIMMSSNPVYSGSFSNKMNTSMKLFFVTQEGDMWHTNGLYVYKNNSLVRSVQSGATISDLKQDESSGSNYVWISGYTCSNPSESLSSDVGWLISNLGGNANIYTFQSDRITTPVGGYQPGNQTYTGTRSPRLGKMTFQYGFVLIDGYDVEEHQYRDYNGNYHYSYYNVDKTYTYDASNGFLRQNSVKYPSDFFFEDQTNERVFFIGNFGTLKYHNLRTNEVSDVNSSLPAISNMRYYNGKIFAYATSGKLLIGTTSQFFNGTYKVVNLTSVPNFINDMFIETTIN